MLGKRIINTATGAAPTPSCTTDTVQILGDTSCIAYYKMNDATDETGSYDGTPTNVNFNVAGKFGNAGEFNGSSSVINLSSNPLDITADFTVSGWLNQASSSVNLFVFSCTDTNTNDIHFNLNFQPTQNRIELVYNNVGYYTPTTYESGWHHYAVTLSGTSLKTYRNGSIIDTRTVTISSTSGNRQTIGTRLRQNYSSYGSGKIDQVRIFNRAITSDEVETLYNEVQCIPTIVPTDYFTPITYTGNGTTQSTNSLLNQVGSVDFQPDLVWVKCRNVDDPSALVDSVRGASETLFSDNTNAQANRTSVTAFNSNGFTLGNYTNTNRINDTYVAWNWKAGGAAVSNTDGTITSQVSANTDAGFSIVKYSSGSSATGTVGHGLSQPPQLVIQKSLGVDNWFIANNAVSGTTNYEYMLFTDAAQSTNWTFWDGASAPTSTTFKNGWDGNREMINYCFHSVDGYSKIGSYVGTGASGNSIVTGFRPAYVMVKKTDATNDWIILDNKRKTDNPINNPLRANTSGAETPANTNSIDFNSNGFTIVGTAGGTNTNGGSYIFLAIAEENVQPEPELANSFNVVTYTGDGGTQNVTGVGFQPDFVWTKIRETAAWNLSHYTFNSLSGPYRRLKTNEADAENTFANSLSSFDDDGFTVNSAVNVNGDGKDFVAWCWKASNDSTINNEGSISSVVSANPAAGFSIVKYTGTGANATVGHGLDDNPQLIIIKNLDASTNGWSVNSSVGATFGVNFLRLNTNDSLVSSSSNVTSVSTSTFSIGTSLNVNEINDNQIAYCFHSVDGYQKVGSYSTTGGSAKTIYTDSNGDGTGTGAFEPRFLLIKRLNGTGGNWYMYDQLRDGTNDRQLYANLSDDESTTGNVITYNSDGFTIAASGSGVNGSSSSYIYLAIA